MGCSGKTVKSDLPIITSIQLAKTIATTTATTKKARAKKVKIVDFHCPQCGIAKSAYPNYRHKCPGVGPVGYQIDRKAICDSCEHNRDGKCLPLAAKHPGKPCLIEIGIPMPDVECPLKKWRRVLFKCDKCGSIRFDENGLTECPTCKPRPKPKLVVIQPVRDVPVEPKNDIAIISVATGQNATEMAKITFPRFQQYADLVSADFIEVRTNHYPRYPLANKFRVGAITANYRRVLFLDADIWLRANVGNLFEMLEPGAIWMHPDVEMWPGLSWSVKQSEAMGKEQSITPNLSRVYNTGVVMFDQDHRDIWSPPPKPMGTTHVSEQFWIEHQAIPCGIRDLHWQFNCQWYWPIFGQIEPHAKVVHLANCPHAERITRLQKYEATDADFI